MTPNPAPPTPFSRRKAGLNLALGLTATVPEVVRSAPDMTLAIVGLIAFFATFALFADS